MRRKDIPSMGSSRDTIGDVILFCKYDGSTLLASTKCVAFGRRGHSFRHCPGRLTGGKLGIPSSVGVLVFTLLFGGTGIALAHRLLWRRSPSLFWLASTLIVVGIGYVVVTGEAESLARRLWPVAFDPVKGEEI